MQHHSFFINLPSPSLFILNLYVFFPSSDLKGIASFIFCKYTYIPT